MCIFMGSADLLATFERSQKCSQDAGQGPGSAAHPMGKLWAMLGGLDAKRKQDLTLSDLPVGLTVDSSDAQILC